MSEGIEDKRLGEAVPLDKIRFTTSSDWEPERYRERQPTEVVDAFLFDGSFPLQFLEGAEQVRVWGEGGAEVFDPASDEPLARLDRGEMLVRFQTLGLRSYNAANFYEQFEAAS